MEQSQNDSNNTKLTFGIIQDKDPTIAEWRQLMLIVNAIQASEQRLLRAATRKEIAAELRLSPRAYLSLILQLGKVCRPFLTTTPTALVRFLELAPGRTISSVGCDASGWEVVELISEAISVMPSDEKTVLALYFKEELTLQEISEVTKLDPETVYYLFSHATLRLRSYLTYHWPTLKPAN